MGRDAGRPGRPTAPRIADPVIAEDSITCQARLPQQRIEPIGEHARVDEHDRVALPLRQVLEFHRVDGCALPSSHRPPRGPVLLDSVPVAPRGCKRRRETRIAPRSTRQFGADGAPLGVSDVATDALQDRGGVDLFVGHPVSLSAVLLCLEDDFLFRVTTHDRRAVREVGMVSTRKPLCHGASLLVVWVPRWAPMLHHGQTAARLPTDTARPALGAAGACDTGLRGRLLIEGVGRRLSEGIARPSRQAESTARRAVAAAA